MSMEIDRAGKKKKRNKKIYKNKKSWHGPNRPTIPTGPLPPDELPNHTQHSQSFHYSLGGGKKMYKQNGDQCETQ